MVVAVAAVAALVLAACGSGGSSSSANTSGKDVAKATSVADAGGMDALVAAAKAEGQLNVITLPNNGVMRVGKLEQIVPPVELYARPATAFVAEFVGTMNRIPGGVTAGGVRVLDTVLADADPGGRAAGTPVDVLARPEDLTLDANPHGTGIVTVTTFLGGITRVNVRLDGDLSVLVDRSSAEAARLAVGAAVDVSVSGRALVVDPL